MPAIPTVDASLTTVATAQAFEAAFFDTYAPELPNIEARLAGVMDLGLTSTAADSRYFYYETASHPRSWKRGESISQDAFKGRAWTVQNFYYARELTWYQEDEDDDQTGQLLPKAEELGSNFAILYERLFFQVLTGGADSDLLAVVPNAADGVGLFSTVNGDGSARFGVTGGNSLTGSGVGTAGAIRQDFYRGLTQVKRFQDTKGQPRFPEEGLKDFVIIHNVANEQLFDEALFAKIVQGAAAGISNTVAESVQNALRRSPPRMFGTQRITDNSWYIFCTNPKRKAIFKQQREGLTSNVGDFSNSDRTRQTRIRSLQFRERLGIGVATPYQCVKITNA